MKIGISLFMLFFVWQIVFSFDTRIYLLEKQETNAYTTQIIRKTPSLFLYTSQIYLGWLTSSQWVRMQITNLPAEKDWVVSSHAPWMEMKSVILSTNGSPSFSLPLPYPVFYFWLPRGTENLSIDIKVIGYPMVVSPRVVEAHSFFSRFTITRIYSGVLKVLFFLLLFWYFWWSVSSGSHKRIWKSVNFMLLGAAAIFLLLPQSFPLPWLFFVVTFFGISWSLYQIIMHPELKRHDMLVLHGIFVVLFLIMGVMGYFNAGIAFILFGIAVHFNLILLIFYYTATKSMSILLFHLLFSFSTIGFFWEFMGVWFSLSPVFPWVVTATLLLWLIAEVWGLFKEMYLDKSLYQFYSNTNRLLKSHLAQSNSQLRETVHKLQKEAIQRSQLAQLYETQQTKYRDLVDNLSDWIWEMDKKFTVTYTSLCIEKLLSLSPADVTNRHIDRIVGKEAFLHLRQAIQASQGNLAGHLLSLSGKKDILLEISASPLVIDGKIEGYRCIGRDVSQLIALRSDLRFYEKNLALLFDRSPLAVAIVDVDDMKFVRWNNAFEVLFPLQRNHLDDFVAKVQGQYVKDIYFYFRNYIGQMEKNLTFLYVPISIDDQTTWMFLQVYKITQDEKTFLLISLYPQQTQMFEFQWSWLEVWPTSVFLMDRYGNMIFGNTKAKEKKHILSSLPHPSSQISLHQDSKGDHFVIVSCTPLLYMVIEWEKDASYQKSLLCGMFRVFPFPWIITDKNLVALEWHPKIFDEFHFQSSHASFLSQMLRESGLSRVVTQSDGGMSHDRIYVQNRLGEVFYREVYFFSIDSHIFLIFVQNDALKTRDESIDQLTQQISSFHVLLQEVYAEFQTFENVEESPLSHDSGGPVLTEIARLTDTEQKIFTLVVAGKSNAEIATIHGVTEETVKGHVKHIFKKMGVQKRYQLIQRYNGRV